MGPVLTDRDVDEDLWERDEDDMWERDDDDMWERDDDDLWDRAADDDDLYREKRDVKQENTVEQKEADIVQEVKDAGENNTPSAI